MFCLYSFCWGWEGRSCSKILPVLVFSFCIGAVREAGLIVRHVEFLESEAWSAMSSSNVRFPSAIF